MAAVRCVVQLAAVSLVIRFALGSMVWTLVFVGGMVTVAAATSARRITGSLRPVAWMALPILAGVVPAVGLSLASQVVPAEPIAVLPSAGILVGGAMSAATLAGRRTKDELTGQHGQYEAALALGLTRRQSVGLVARSAAGLALVPGLDQTRTVGLVTLPGAFVGVLLSGASPLQAGVAQTYVLIALLAVQAISAAVTVELIASARLVAPGLELRE
jgi:putative ABC transport system permease protein